MSKANSNSQGESQSIKNSKPPQNTSPGGFYKRRRAVVEHIEAGTIDLLEDGIHDYLSLKANLLIGSPSSIPAGVCFTSAPAIHAHCKRVSERTIQRCLEHLEAIDWLKTWKTPGKRGNYPTLLCRASVHDLSGNEYRVNAEATTDWRHPVYDPVGELSGKCRHSVFNLAGNRELRKESKEERKVSHDGPTDSLSLTGRVWEELKIPSLPVRFKGFVELVVENLPGEDENLIPWYQRILDLCAERSIEYPRVFFKRFKDCERNRKSARAPNPVHGTTGNKLEVPYA